MFMREYSINKSAVSTACAVWWRQQYTKLHANKITEINMALALSIYALAFIYFGDVIYFLIFRYNFSINHALLQINLCKKTSEVKIYAHIRVKLRIKIFMNSLEPLYIKYM